MKSVADYLLSQGVEVFYGEHGLNLGKPPDIVHHFNLGRPEMGWIAHHKWPQAKVIVNSIYVDFQLTERIGESGWRKALLGFLGFHRMEWLKEIGRAVKGQRPSPSIAYLMKGQSQMIRDLLKSTQALITASSAEYRSISKAFPKRELAECKIIPPSLPLTLTKKLKHDLIQDKVGLLSVGRIEPRKNQLRLIHAFSPESHGSLSIIGDPAPNQLAYYEKCKEVGNPKRVNFYASMPHEELVNHYKKAKVHCLPSFHETTGLVTLEAMAFGCQVLVGDLPIEREIFGTKANFVDPSSERSIKQGIDHALTLQDDHREWILSNFYADKVGESTWKLYREVLNK